MPTIPSGDKVIFTSANVDMTERKSAKLNSKTHVYTMQDIASSVSETGDWEPTVTWFTAPVPGLFGEAGESQATFWDNRSTYSKIGNVVTVQLYLNFQFPIGVIGTGGQIAIAGLPYAAVSPIEPAGSMTSIGRANLTNATGDVVTSGCRVIPAWWVGKTAIIPTVYTASAGNVLVMPFPTSDYFFQGSLTTPQGNDTMRATVTYITS